MQKISVSLILIFLFTSCKVDQAKEVSIITRNTKFMNKDGIFSFVSKVFGPEGKKLAVDVVSRKPSVWGGACDPYRGIVKNGKIKNGHDDFCYNGINESRNDFHVDSGAMRLLALSDLCEKLTNCTLCLNYLEKNIIQNGKMELDGIFIPQEKIRSQISSKLGDKKDIKEKVLFLCKLGAWQLD